MATQDIKPTETTGKEVPQSQPQSGQFLSSLDDFDQWLDEMRRQWLTPMPALFGRHWPEAVAAFGAGRLPRVDVIDRDTEFCVRAELPGVSKENLDVSLHENTVTLRATTQKEETEEKGQYHRREMSRGEFQRTVRLSGAVEGDNAKAVFKDGILELTIPKAPGVKRQPIKVE
ncbi:Hsp20/alpha crystallin family protein [Methylomagnum sp.]